MSVEACVGTQVQRNYRRTQNLGKVQQKKTLNMIKGLWGVGNAELKY